MLPYPFWVKASVVKAHPIAGDLPFVVTPWVSDVQRTAEGIYEVEDVLTTTEGGAVAAAPYNIDPQQQFQFDRNSLGVKTLGVAMRARSVENASVQGGRIVLVGDADFLTDQFTREGSPNLAFGLNTVDWLTQDEALISIRTKSRLPAPLQFPDDGARTRVRYFNLIGMPLFVGIFAIIRLFLRRRRSANQ